MGKTRYYAFRVEFQERGSPHVHPFVWILNSPNISNETEDLVFIEKSIYQTHWSNLNVFNLLNYIRFISIQRHVTNIEITSADFRMIEFLQIGQ